MLPCGPSGETRTPDILLPNGWTKFFLILSNGFNYFRYIPLTLLRS